MPEPPDRPFDEGDLDPDPLVLFGRWFEEAEREAGFEANAVALATASADGAPSARMVLMKAYDERGITFFTNYGSRKAGELDVNPRAALPSTGPGSAGRCGSRARSRGWGARSPSRMPRAAHARAS